MRTAQGRAAGPGAAARRSTRIAFFIAGFGMAAWAPLVPFARSRLALDDGTLGLLLLCLGAGSIVAMPLAGALAQGFGCRPVVVAATALIGAMLPLLATVTSLPVLVTALVLFGAAIGTVDCVINIQAVIVERAAGRPLMSGFHGLFSLGGIAGAGGVVALLSLGASPLLATIAVVACLALAIGAAAPDLLPYGGEGDGSPFAIPRGIVLFIGVLCFVVFLTEGAMLDWSAVFLVAVSGLSSAQAGLGYAVFAAAMTIGRLTGDRVVAGIGARRVVAVGGLAAAAGLALAVLAPAWPVALAGFALVGAGCANIVPVLYTAIGRQTVMPEHAAVPAVSTLGYAGILAGPAAIGFVAQATSLSAAFLLVVLALLGVAASARFLRA